MSKQLTLSGGTAISKKQTVQWIDQMVFALFAPIIGSPAWATIINQQQIGRIKAERLKAVMRSVKDKVPYDRATDYEALIYLHTASLEAPMADTWNRIFFHLFKKFYPGAPSSFIRDHEASISQYEEHELADLKRWIFRRQKIHMREKRSERKEAKKKAAVPKTDQSILT